MNALPFKTTTLLAGEALALLVGLALLIHNYREWEYLAHAENPFCANTPRPGEPKTVSGKRQSQVR
jgi:hypothetical protein